MARHVIAACLDVPVYAQHHESLGRSEVLADVWSHWKEGDRRAAVEAVPNSVVNDLIIWGTPEHCREQIARYVENGVTTPVIAVMPFGVDLRQAIRDLAPR